MSRGLQGPRGGCPSSAQSIRSFIHSFSNYWLPSYRVQGSVPNAGDS